MSIRQWVVTAGAMFATAAPCVWAQDSRETAAGDFPPRDEVLKILADRIDSQHRSIGMVVGLITPQGRRVIGYGQARDGSTSVPDGDTVFEIGSVTKVFTGLLFADMARKREVGLDDPLQKYLPVDVKVPERDGHGITLLDLATHTSGLPFWPADMPAGGSPGAAGYTQQQLLSSLERFQLPQVPGSQWGYSNIDYALLGMALARRAGMAYEPLLRMRVLGPLAMGSTAMAPSRELQPRLASGHDITLKPAPEWNAAVLAPAGSLLSTANDLLKFMAAVVGTAKSPLQASMAAMLQAHRPATPIGADQTLGWWVFPNDAGPITLMVGGTAGFASALVWDEKRHEGVVVLSNSVDAVQDIAIHLLRPSVPLSEPVKSKPHNEVALDPGLLPRYAGTYQPSAGPAFTISRESEGLMIQLAGIPKLRLRPESDREFFLGEINLQVTFEIDPAGLVTGLIIHTPGAPDSHALRMADK